MKRWGKRSVTGCSGRRGSTPLVGECGSGAGDGTVAMGASTTGGGKEAAGMSSRIMCSPRSYPRW